MHVHVLYTPCTYWQMKRKRMKMWKKTKNKKSLPLSTSGRAGMPVRWVGCTSLTGKVLGIEVGEWG